MVECLLACLVCTASLVLSTIIRTTTSIIRAGEMVPWLRVLVAHVMDLSSVPNTHNGWLTTTHNPSFRGPNVHRSSGLGRHLHSQAHSNTPPPHTHTEFKINR